MTDTELPWEALMFQDAVKAAGTNYTRLGHDSGIAREVLSKYANGKRSITADAAAVLAPLLGVDPSNLLPPETPRANSLSPLALLEELAKTVASQQRQITRLTRRVRTLERRGEAAG